MAFLTKDRGITEKGVRALFVKNFITRRRSLVYPKFCEAIDSYVETDFARSLGTVPQLEEVIDNGPPPVMPDFAEYSWTWRNRRYEALIGVTKSALQYDQVGQLKTLIASMAGRLANLPDVIFVNRLSNSTALTGGDGVAFFSSSHPAPRGGSTQSNLLTGTTSSTYAAATHVTTLALQIQNDFQLAYRTMLTFKDDQNQPWNPDRIPPENLVILCGPLLYPAMQMAFGASQINATTNQFKGAVGEIVSSNYLPISGSTAADWYLFNIGNLSRPFVYSRFRRIRDEEIQDAISPELYAETTKEEAFGITIDDLRELTTVGISTNLNRQGMNADADTLLHNRFLIKAEWLGEIFPGEWRNAVMVNNS